MFKWIRKIRENYKKTMNTSSEKCHHCNHYSYSFINGGLAKIEHCQKCHKDGSDECPDFEQFCLSDWDSCIYHNGRIER